MAGSGGNPETALPPRGKERGGGTISRRVVLALGLILLLAAVLRLHHLKKEPLWSDETLSVRAACLSVSWILTKAPEWEHNPPLYDLMLHGWAALAGTSPGAVRVPSVLFGVATVLMLFLVGREVGGDLPALAAAFLGAVSPFLIEYSQEARAYSLLVLLATASYYFFIRLVLGGGSSGAAAGYGLTTALLLYTQTHAVFVVLAQIGTAAVLAWRRAFRGKRWLTALGFALLAFLPWLPTIWRQSRIVSAWRVWWIPVPTPRHLLWAFYSLLGFPAGYPLQPGPPPWLPDDRLAPLLLALVLLTAILTGAGLAGRSAPESADTGRPPSSPGRFPRAILLGLWLAVPILLPFLISQVSLPVFHPRFLIAAVPPLLLLTALGIRVAARRGPAVLGLCLVFLALQLPGIARFYQLPRKEQWDRAARLLTEEGRPGDLVVLSCYFIKTPMDYYYPGPLPEVRVNDFDEPFDAAAKLLPVLPGRKRLWLVDAHASRKTALRALRVLLPAGPLMERKLVGVTVSLYEIPGRY